MHAKGYAAPETKASVERARALIDRAESLGEPHIGLTLGMPILHWSGIRLTNVLGV